MKILHLLIVKLVCLFALVLGVLLLVMWFDQAKYDLISQYMLTQVWPRWGAVAGIVVVIFGLVGFLPLQRQKVSRNIISYPGAHGSVTIQLDSVESTLSRVLSKLPEVRKINVRVTATEDNHSARVSADVLVYKGANSASAREITNRIGTYLHDAAVNILGAEEVTSVNLNIRGIVVDAGQANILRDAPDRDSAVREREALLRDEPVAPAREDLRREREALLRDEPRVNTQFAAQDYESEPEYEPEPEAPAHDAHEVVVSSDARVVGASDTSFGALLDDEEEPVTEPKKRFDEDESRA